MNFGLIYIICIFNNAANTALWQTKYTTACWIEQTFTNLVDRVLIQSLSNWPILQSSASQPPIQSKIVINIWNSNDIRIMWLLLPVWHFVTCMVFMSAFPCTCWDIHFNMLKYHNGQYYIKVHISIICLVWFIYQPVGIFTKSILQFCFSHDELCIQWAWGPFH